MSVVMAQENKLMRRVAGHHNYRLDGMGDILTRCRGASVLDVGCSRGQIGYDFVINGATLLHGCDIDPESINIARAWHVDSRAVETKFEVVDLSKGHEAFRAAFGEQKYDIVLMVAVYHKLKRIMSAVALANLMRDFGTRTNKYFCWRATSDKPHENDQELGHLDQVLGGVGLKRVHTSRLSEQLQHCAIWVRH